ncbi:hypothetical protein [Marinibacterium profundimaris]|uniref:Asl1-like glycosyl hydrolase catalytic domain-containing protein n=1 Tax=Marinibacterium profundimaris TaxID=1679460 RepID=A0A225NH99_9RHOB|nr:hypothetical protein [Marinibacterium profundimaris]OWU72234.1 hypothetical protein ATO3_16855 [Marinibacterium profundimaris]
MKHAVLAACLASGAAMAWAGPGLQGPRLGAASNFGQSWQPQAVAGGAEAGILRFRDEIIWNHVEQMDGTLRFGSTREAYARMLSARDATMTLLGYTGHPRWDDGRAPQSEEGQAAFARYHAQIVGMFPLIDSLEIGNEFNSHEFAEHEGWPDDLAERARTYVRLALQTVPAVHAERPDLRILGGAAHSIPVAWAEALMAAGLGDLIDAFVLHPYTTEPEQFVRQVARLRQVPGLEDMPLAVTEFGTRDAGAAPGYLMRYYCQMALAGVTQADWYPFSPRGDGLEPLVDEDGALTDTGATYALIRTHLEGRPARDVAPDPFTYACAFGPDALVIWGAPRAVSLSPGLEALDATGQPMAAPVLSRTEPLLILGDGIAPTLDENVALGVQQVLADSYDQFPQAGSADLFLRRGGEGLPLEPRPGQERDGVPWTPYLGFEQDGSVMVGAGWAVPSAWGPEDPLEIVHRYTAPADLTLDVEISARPSSASEDGVSIALERNGEVLSHDVLTGPRQLGLTSVNLHAGDVLDVVLGPNGNSAGDHTDLRITLRRAG